MRTTTPSSIQSEEALTFATKSVSVALEETTKETDTLPRTAVGSEKGGESNLRSGEPITHEWGVGGGEAEDACERQDCGLDRLRCLLIPFSVVPACSTPSARPSLSPLLPAPRSSTLLLAGL